jgi:hypothetical protein
MNLLDKHAIYIQNLQLYARTSPYSSLRELYLFRRHTKARAKRDQGGLGEFPPGTLGTLGTLVTKYEESIDI